jgi:hypothetical protein
MQQGSVARKQAIDRRHFIGGSDARIIMGQDEKALIRLCVQCRVKHPVIHWMAATGVLDGQMETTLDSPPWRPAMIWNPTSSPST